MKDQSVEWCTDPAGITLTDQWCNWRGLRADVSNCSNTLLKKQFVTPASVRQTADTSSNVLKLIETVKIFFDSGIFDRLCDVWKAESEEL